MTENYKNTNTSFKAIRYYIINSLSKDNISKVVYNRPSAKFNLKNANIINLY